MEENDPVKIGLSVLEGITPAKDEEVEKYEQAMEEERQKEIKAKKELHYAKYANVPLRFLKESLSTYKPSEENRNQYNWLCGFVKSVQEKTNTKNILYINGKFGRGKSHLACGIIRELGGYLLTSLELCIAYDSCRDFKSTMTRYEYLKKICAEKVLVIDEVGKGIEAIEKQILPYIVNEFYGNKNILVFVGNGEEKDLYKLIGEAGADRMKEVGQIIPLIGESIRGKNDRKEMQGL